jgi:RNA-directed DNA polymerase
MDKAKPFSISKQVVWEAYQKVKANQGAAGVDEESIQDFEKDLKNNLYKIWNRMSSGTYFPPPVLRVETPKSGGGVRMLGIPSVSDRIAQMVATRYLEPVLEPHFHPDSYGYRPGKSAHDALEVTRRRCWSHNWVIDLDIKGFFDNIDHELLIRAVQKHTDSKWILLYVERWIKAPAQTADGTLIRREKGTPQGGVISPLLANLFLHYALDVWLRKNHPQDPFERYADDAIVHCSTEAEAKALQAAITARLAECRLELNPEKTKIVYCKDSNRRRDYDNVSFDFLGYTFRPRLAMNRSGQGFVSFSPAISKKAAKRLRHTMRGWGLHRRSDLSLEDLRRLINPIVRGWINYYGRYYRTVLRAVLWPLHRTLIRWVTRKYKTRRGRRRATRWLHRVAKRCPALFAHWQFGVRPVAG